jgi:hypothetical protein
VGHEVVGEERQLIEVRERAGLPAECSGEIGRGDLRALQERHLELLVGHHVAVERHPEEDAHELGRRALRGAQQAEEGPAGAARDQSAQLAPGARVERHQLGHVRARALLAEQHRHARRVPGRELAGRWRAVRAEEAAERGLDRAIARLAPGLDQLGEPARAEVDRVQADHERRGRLRVAPELGQQRGGRRLQLGDRKVLREAGESVRVDAHLARPGSHLGAAPPDRAERIGEQRLGELDHFVRAAAIADERARILAGRRCAGRLQRCRW